MTLSKFVASLILLAFVAFNGTGHPTIVSSGPKSASVAVSLEKYIRTELYFGLSRKSGGEISETDFQAFIDEFVTPRFPDGLTIFDAQGQWREGDTTIAKERSKVLVLIYLKRDRRSADRKIDEIRSEYKKRFAQSSVLRVDTSKSLRVSF